ncbi:MAG: EAL domain-containing protein [Rhizobiaceae bacterium]
MNIRVTYDVPTQVLEQVPLKSSEGLALALADEEDGAVMVFQWCNKRFGEIIGFDSNEVIGQRGTILIGPDVEQGTHLLVIDKLMNWERFSVKTANNRKNGEHYWVEINWTPLSDPISGSRWWLCSLIEFEPQAREIVQRHRTGSAELSDELVIRYSDEIVRLEKENRRLHNLAKTVAKESNEDPLTGLSNRRNFEVSLKSWVAGLRKGGSSFAVIYIDLDRFKSVNDTLGHDAGDKLLMSIAQMLRRISGENDLVARIGGDEFVLLKPLDHSALSISNLADEIIRETRKPHAYEGKTFRCSASVGVAIADGKTANPEQVVADADSALYHSKTHGRGRWSFFTAEMHAEAILTKQLATELLVACDRREFVPYFQPIIDAKSGAIASAEVLVRWAHPERGLIPPVEFLHVAAKMGILHRIDEIVFNSLPAEVQHLDNSGIELPKVAINVSAGRLEDPSFIHDIRSSGVDPTRLTVEILESVYLERMSDTVHWALSEFRDLGVAVAVDDFGTGHASVQGLLKIKPSVLKIDRQFIMPIVEDQSSRSLLASLIGIGQSLGMTIVAEGIESDEHAQIATEYGCDYLQGFFFGRPMTAENLHKRLRSTGGKFW